MNFLFVSMNLFPQIKALVFAESALLSVVIIWSGIKKVIVVRYALSPLKRRLERFLFAGWINFIFFYFTVRRTSKVYHRRYFYSQLGPGALTAHRRVCLALLHSWPDAVHRFLLRKTQTSTPLIEGSSTIEVLRLASPLL